MDFYYCKMVLEVYLCKEKNAEKKQICTVCGKNDYCQHSF